MKNKQIIILIVVIFIAFVGYKAISSNIQENKEKNVILERYRLEQLKEQNSTDKLNSCLSDAKNVYTKDTAFVAVLARCWGVGTLDNNSLDVCMKNEGAGRTICQLQEGICLERTGAEMKTIKDKFEKDEQECYTRFK